LRTLPSLLVSIIVYAFCSSAILLAWRYFHFSGLCCAIACSAILANIQVLYASSYDLLHAPTLLGTVVFSSSFLALDMINHCLGARHARSAIWISLFFQLFFFLNMLMTLGHKPLDYAAYPNFSIPEGITSSNINSMAQIFIPIPRILIASYAAFLSSQLAEVFLYKFFAKDTKYKLLHHNISLFISSVLIDTGIFTLTGFVLLSKDPLSVSSFLGICWVTIFIRVLCNCGNALVFKKFIHYSKKNKQL
jgi:uncharacterized integral membrane protein (TIGR00697 family)